MSCTCRGGPDYCRGGPDNNQTCGPDVLAINKWGGPDLLSTIRCEPDLQSTIRCGPLSAS